MRDTEPSSATSPVPSPFQHPQETGVLTPISQMRELKPKVLQLVLTMTSKYTVGVHVLIQNIY